MISLRLALMAMAMAPALLVAQASAQVKWASLKTAEAKSSEMELLTGQGAVIDLDSDIVRTFTSNPDVADISVAGHSEVLVNAKALGIATLMIWTNAGARQSVTVRVSRDLQPVRTLLNQAFPAENLRISGSKDALAIIGSASSQEVVDRAIALLKPFAQSVVSNAQIAPQRGVRQIALQIVFAELDRTKADSFGVNLLSTGAANTPGRITTGQFSSANPTQVQGTIGGPINGTNTAFNLSNALNIFAFRPDLNLGAAIQALENEGVLQILARPNLVATDGKEAKFVVGGEFPVPVVQAGVTPGAITVQYREFGIRLAFLPHVTPNGTVQMHLIPEVSTLDQADGVVISGFNIPALSTRRVETDIELKPGQTFVIAGLLDDRVTDNLSRIPGLANIPLLGELFRSRARTKSKTELVVLVTPELRYPLDNSELEPIPQMPETFLPPLPQPQNKEQK
jgi:pilus assembly protein CpaC